MISKLNSQAKDGWGKNKNGGITEVREGTGGTLGDRVVVGQMLQMINTAGQEDGKGLEELKQVVGVDRAKGEEIGF